MISSIIEPQPSIKPRGSCSISLLCRAPAQRTVVSVILFTTVTFRDAPISATLCSRGMSLRFKNPLAFVVGAAASLFIVCTLLVTAATPVFAGNGGDGGCHGTQLTTVGRGTQLPVRRIMYLKDCAAIDV